MPGVGSALRGFAKPKQYDFVKLRSSKKTEKLKADLENEVAALTEKLNQQNDESEELKLVKKDLTEQIQKEADLSKKNLQEMKAEKEMLVMNHDSELASLNNELQKLQDNILERDEKIENINWKKGEMERQLAKLKGEFDEEMSEMVDVVNDLKVKEDDL